MQPNVASPGILRYTKLSSRYAGGDPNVPWPVLPLFQDTFQQAAGDWTNTRNAAAWPTVTENFANGVLFDGNGNVTTAAGGGYAGSGVTKSLLFTLNNQRRITAKNVTFPIYGGTPTFTLGLDYDAAGTSTVGFAAAIVFGGNSAGSQVIVYEHGVAKATYNVPSLLTGSLNAFALDLSAWNGATRTLTAYLNGVAVATWSSAIAPVAGNNHGYVAWSGGSSTGQAASGGITITGS